ncbi:hypothetical protein I3842_09G170900 [Carya illinoinensis]|uniref:Uncharacterized protein n=1 Tax=Carya illinoinensis TaxID=32201 RepID=A0A922E5G9_CARIL|nr:hypothetical protein I3842_09G170900 [Carya illinoinensis]
MHGPLTPAHMQHSTNRSCSTHTCISISSFDSLIHTCCSKEKYHSAALTHDSRNHSVTPCRTHSHEATQQTTHMHFIIRTCRGKRKSFLFPSASWRWGTFLAGIHGKEKKIIVSDSFSLSGESWSRGNDFAGHSFSFEWRGSAWKKVELALLWGESSRGV